MINKTFAAVLGGLLSVSVLSGCTSSGEIFKLAFTAAAETCDLELAEIPDLNAISRKPSPKSTATSSPSASTSKPSSPSPSETKVSSDTQKFDFSVAAVTKSGETVTLNTVSKNDHSGVTPVIEECLLRSLEFDASLIKSVQDSKTRIDSVLKAAVDKRAALKKQIRKKQKSVKSLKKSLSSTRYTNGQISKLASIWRAEYNKNKICGESYYDDWTEEYIDDTWRCTFDEWLEEYKDWYWGDPTQYLSGTGGTTNSISKDEKRLLVLQERYAKGLVFPKGSLETFQPLGFNGYSIAWFYTSKEQLILSISRASQN